MTLEEYKAKKNKNSAMTLEEYKAKKYNTPQTVEPATKVSQPVSTVSESNSGFKSLPLEDVKKMTKEERGQYNSDYFDHILNYSDEIRKESIPTRSTATTNLSKMVNTLTPEARISFPSINDDTKTTKKTSVGEKLLNTAKAINDPILYGLQKKNAEENGYELPETYNVGEIVGKTVGTPVAIAGKAGVGVLKAGEGAADLALRGANAIDVKGKELSGKLAENIGKKTGINALRDYGRDRQQKAIEQDEFIKALTDEDLIGNSFIAKGNEEFREKYSYLPKSGGTVAEFAGELIGPAGISKKLSTVGKVGKYLTILPYAFSMGGERMQQEVNAGTDSDAAFQAGLRTAGSTAIFGEVMTIASPLVNRGAQTLLSKTPYAKNIVANVATKYLAETGTGIAAGELANIPLKEEEKRDLAEIATVAAVFGAVNTLGSTLQLAKNMKGVTENFEKDFTNKFNDAYSTTDPQLRAQKFTALKQEVNDVEELLKQNKIVFGKENVTTAVEDVIKPLKEVLDGYIATSGYAPATNLLSGGASSNVANSLYALSAPNNLPQTQNTMSNLATSKPAPNVAPSNIAAAGGLSGTLNNSQTGKTLEELIPTGKNVAQNDTQNVQNKQVDKTNQAENKTAVNGNMEQSKQNLIKDVENNKYLTEKEKKDFIDSLNEVEYTKDVEADVRDIMNLVEEERGLKNITNNFNETKPIYNKYVKNNVEYDKQYIDLAKDSVKANNSGKRTKEQWLQVARNLGNQIYEMSDSEIEKQAFKSWIDNRPNNANALNRQGKKYVKFTMDDWVNQVYDTVRAARNNAQQVVDNRALQKVAENTAETVQNTAENKTTAQRDTVYSMAKETNKKQVPDIKQKQLDIIKSTNPMTDDYHTGIRNVEDIKSFNETLNDEESFTYGDFTREDALKAVEKGEVKVYSSKPIANGGFVSTSYNMAKDYAGSGKVYSETVPLTDVAWINGDEGQLARVENIEKKEYNKIKRKPEPSNYIYKRITNIDKAKINSDYLENRKKYVDDIGAVDFSNVSYIYQKTDYGIEILKKFKGSQEFINKVKGEVENGINGRSIGFDRTNARARHSKQSNSNLNANSGEPSGRIQSSGANTKIGGTREQNNQTRADKDDGQIIKNSNKSSFSMPDIDYTQDRNLTSKVLDYYSTFYRERNGVDSKRFSDFFNKHKSDFDDYQNPYVMNLERKGALSRDIYNINDNLVKLTTIKEGDKLFIEELYVEKQRQGAGSKVVKILQEYAKKAGLEIETSHELNTAKGFWDKTLNREDSNAAGNKPAFSISENTTDNKGRKLSKQQQEYFKDSKVRDENGNLKVMYHYTNDNFNVVDFKKNAQGLFWLVDSSNALENGDIAANGLRQGKEIQKKELYVNMKNPANYEQYDKYTIQQLKEKGFDGLLFDDGEGTIVGAVFDSPNQIKNVDNTNPTTDEDIRKFKSSENGKPYMDLNGHISMDNNSNVERVGLSQIEKAINDIVTTKVGKFRQKAYGIYKNNAEIIRLKEKNDVPVALHELTHHLDKKYGLSDLGKFDDELSAIAVAKEDAPMSTKIAEGVAEFGRYYMTDKEYAKTIAPKYYEAFEEALTREPEMKNNVEKLQQMVSDYLNQSPLNRMASHIDFGDEEASLWQKSKSKISEFKKNFRKNFVDELDPMKKIVNDITNGKKLNVEEDPTELMRLLNGVTGKVRVALEYGIVDNNGNKIGKSLKEIINPVANNMEEFIAYTSALRARDLANNNMESGFNPKDVDEIINLYQNNTTFNKAAKELYKFQNDILEKTLVDSGIITKEAMEAYNKNNPHYVPFYRVMDENFKQSKDSLSKKPKKIKGSTRDIINPIESIIKNTYSYTLIAEKNKIYKTLFNLANKYDGTGKWFDKVPTDMVGETISAKDVKDILEKLNLDREDIDYNEVFTTIFKPSYSQKGNVITVMDNGKPVHYEINDKELYDILAPAYSNKKENLLLDLLNRGASALRVGATHSLEFVFRNPLRDTFTAGAFSDNGFIPLVDTIRGIFEVAGKTDLYYKWLEGGGSGSTYTNAQRTTLKNTLKDILPEATRKNNSTMEKTLDILLNTTKHPLRTYLDVVGNISNMMEEGTRLGEFRRAYNKTNSIKKSALDSRDITVDFSRGGVTGKEINKYVAFLNANIQGLDKTVRSFKDRPFATSMKVLAMLTLPSILLRLLQDPDDMDKIAQWEKDTYWVFYVNGVPIKIPKPQGPIQMFATLPERVIDFIRTKDSHALDGLIERTVSSSSPVDSYTSLIPTGAQPIIENATNYSFFRQQPIVKQSLQSRSPKYQYDENTSTIAKMVGGATNKSPKMIDNLISGYFGNLGRDVVNLAGAPIDMVNLLVNGTGKKKEYNNLNSTLRKVPLIKGFVANDTYSKALDDFYDEKSRVSTAYTDAKFVYGDHPTSEQSKELEQLKELNSKYNKTYNEIKKINEQIDNVKQSNYSNKQKESLINTYKEEIDKKAKDLEKETEELKKSIKRLK